MIQSSMIYFNCTDWQRNYLFPTDQKIFLLLQVTIKSFKPGKINLKTLFLSIATITESLANERVPKQRLVVTQNNNGSTTARGPHKRKYLWKVIGFSACSKSCGGGVQQPIIKCVRESPTRVFSAKRCAHLQQPILNENLMRSNTQPCPAYWKLGEWDQCNCEEKYDEVVLRTREVKCVQELLSGIVIQVNSGACMDDVPSSTESCECSRVIKPTTTSAPQVGPPRYKAYSDDLIPNYGNSESIARYGG
ncbi:A disintegrin and metalloproteinase with thrombospondin motifs 6-like [Anopheles darlingi]|uniref:A disintegrin and metalloproteinase with thrombospondin motifs 6-like n=1 Tax=Anopheles darlingi TaxID=43151 RepID=UPI0020FFF956|nr:A disintegrin and metalloproteinase with thrombospondin motifs 6-like [Anopheles darlingi]